jgi:O-antigen/teichoic acid export membrane protein
MHQKTSVIVRGAGAYFAATVIGSAGSFLVSLIIAWGFGREGLGVFAVVMTVVLIGVVLSELGLNPYILRTYPHGDGDIPFRSVIRLRAVASIGAALVLSGAVIVVAPERSDGAIAAAIAILIFSRSVGSGFENLIKAERRLSAVFAVTLAFAVIQGAMAYEGIRVFHGVGEVILVLAFTDIVRVVVLALLCRDAIARMPASGSMGDVRLRSLLVGTIPFMTIGLMSLLSERADVILLAGIRDAATAGVYSAADRFLVLVAFVDGSVIAATLPQVRPADPARERDTITKQLLIIGFALSLGIALILYFGSGIIIRSTFRFEDSVALLQLLAFAIPAMIAGRTLRTVLYAAHRERFVAWVFGASALSGILLNILFIPRYGAFAPALITLLLEYAVAIIFGAMYIRTRNMAE